MFGISPAQDIFKGIFKTCASYCGVYVAELRAARKGPCKCTASTALILTDRQPRSSGNHSIWRAQIASLE